jgi:S1-C subfamily serine protease
MSVAPGSALTLTYRRGHEEATTTITLAKREPALLRNSEQRTWGAVLRNISRELARSRRLPDTNGVWIESVRPGGAAGQAEPELKTGDVVVSIDTQPVATLADLRAISTAILADPAKGKDVLVGIRRNGALLDTVVDLRITDSHQSTPQAPRSWVGVEVQSLSRKLATRLGIDAESGVRITRVHPGTRAATADLRVGDVILKIDDEAVTARRTEDKDVFARQIRRYRVDTEVALTIWREGARTTVPVRPRWRTSSTTCSSSPCVSSPSRIVRGCSYHWSSRA